MTGTKAPPTMELRASELHGALADPALAAMNFLNEVANRYPDAISFAPGRPYEGFFDIEEIHEYLRAFRRYLATNLHYTEDQVRTAFYQYGRTKGIIHELVARNLAVDEDIHVDPESIVVTVGCQEAMVLVLRALRAGDRDVVLAVSPTYVGLTGAARLVDLPVLPVASDRTGIDLDDLTATVRRARQAGLRPRACYVMPDFTNPSGVSMSETTRRRLLDVAWRNEILLLEDNPYGLFHGDHDRVPTLKALDERKTVVYLGSYAKSALPGARIGYVIADQPVIGGGLFADELSKIKSMLTVNTPAIAQAVVGGKLVVNDCDLATANTKARRLYADNLNRITTGLAERFPPGSGVEWNTPTGGFFLVVTVPFTVDDALLEYSARRHRVLWTPMSHFYDGPGGDHQLRLSASLVTGDQIDEGLDRLAALITERLPGGADHGR